jgi:hypothetical protein
MLESPRSRPGILLYRDPSNQGGLQRQISKSPVFLQASMVRVRPMNTRGTSAIAKPRFHKPLLFASTKEAVVYLELMGFSLKEKLNSCSGLAMATHRTLYARDWL